MTELAAQTRNDEKQGNLVTKLVLSEERSTAFHKLTSNIFYITRNTKWFLSLNVLFKRISLRY